MTNLQSKITDEGTYESGVNKINGYYTKIVDFGVSENYGAYETTRNTDSVNTLFCLLPISGSIPIDSTTRQLNLSIPPNVVDPNGNIITSNKNIAEVYLFAEGYGYTFSVNLGTNEIIVPEEYYLNTETGKPIRFNIEEGAILPNTTSINIAINKTFYVIKSTTANRLKIASSKANALSGNALTFLNTGTGVFKICKYFLYAFGQFSPTPLVYNYTGETKLRGQLKITNLNTFSLQFTYTQAFEIEDHGIDPNAHKNLQDAMNYNGIYVNDINFVYKGQAYIKSPVFHASVLDNMIVYLNVTNGKWYPAIAGGSGDTGKWRGIAKLSENKIILNGPVKTTTNITRGSDVYLSDNDNGLMTADVTSSKIGYSLGDGVIVISNQGSGSGSNDITNINGISINNLRTRDILIVDPTGETTNFVNMQLVLNHLSDVDDNLSPEEEHIFFYDGTNWISKQLELNDLKDFNVATSSLSGKYLRNDGTNWTDSDLLIPASDSSNEFLAKSFVFGSGFSLSEAGNIVTVELSGSSEIGLSAVVEDPTPKLGGNLDVYGGNIQLRGTKSFTTLVDISGTNIFTDNDPSVNFLNTPAINENTDYLVITVNGVTSTISIAFVTDGHNITLNNTLPDIDNTDTVTYSIIRPLISKITNTNTLGSKNTVVIDKLEASLGASLETKGWYIVSGGAYPININAQNELNLSSNTGDIVLSAAASGKQIKLNNWNIPTYGTGAVNLPSISSLPSVNQTLGVTAVDGGTNTVTLGWITNSGGISLSNANPNSLNNVKPLLVAGSSSAKKIRGIRKGNNIALQMTDQNGNITTNEPDQTDVLIHADMSTIFKGWGSGTGVYTTSTAMDSNGRQAIVQYGIRGSGSVSVAFEIDPTDSSKKNIVISGSSSGGGTTSGMTAGSMINRSGGTLGLGFSNAVNAFRADNSQNGLYANNNSYGAYIENSTNAGIGLANNETGIVLNATNRAQIQFIQKFSRTDSSHALSTAPGDGEFNYIAANQLVSNTQNPGVGNYNNPKGLYIYMGSLWYQISLSGAYRTTP